MEQNHRPKECQEGFTDGRNNLFGVMERAILLGLHRLPLEGERVLVFLRNYNLIKIDYLVMIDVPTWACTLDREQNEVSHWMPIPSVPEKQDN